MKEELKNVSQESIAQALAADYFCIYYVNVENNKFTEYSASKEYRALGLPKSGDDFIGFSRERFELLIDPDDREMFLDCFTKEDVIAALDYHGIYTLTFRMMFAGKSTYVHLKVTRMIEEETRHIVIGISSVDDQIRAQQAFRQAHDARIRHSRIAQALTGDYFSIYVVEPDTDEFVLYSSAGAFDELGVETSGGDFFNLRRQKMDRIIYQEDKDRFMGIFTKEKIMTILERDGSFTMKYRLMIGGEPTYTSMKATVLEDEDGRHLIIGTSNIDAQMKREENYQKKMAEAKTTAKNDFLANMSHDIRTPMNAIIGYTNIAKSRLDEPEVVEDSLEKIGSSSHFLLSLINDVLDISKIESGRMQINEGECDLAAVLHRIEDITYLQAQNKSLIISYDHSSVQHYMVRGDEMRIEQILINIVSNAIKYTPNGKSVALIAEEEPSEDPGKNHYRFIVRDTGVGISEEYLPHIFDSFTREQSTLVNRTQGTGLGLAITAKVVELMGGTISVKSKLGEGSEFTVDLDLEAAEEVKPDQPSQEAESGEALTGMKILLVEDNDINAEIAKMVLAQKGAEVDRAENGQVGFDQIRAKGEGYYDAVLMDIQMPVMNGYEATEAIRSLPGDYCRNLPIIAMSANAYEEDVRTCLDIGMNAHIAKPFQPEQLYKLLEQLV